MLVSVIVPNYNHGPFLRKRIDSILNQTYKNYELIILDDCSTDDSREIIESYRGNSRIKIIIYNEENSGSTFRQWKKGMEYAKGEWVWFAESDDVADPDFLQTLLKKATSEHKLIFCSAMDIDASDKLIGLHEWAWALNRKRWESDFENDGLNEIKNYLLFRNTIINASSVLFRNNISIPDEVLNMRFCGDWYFWIHILKTGKLYYFSKPLNYLRIHNTITHSRLDRKSELKRISEWSSTIEYALKIIGRNRFSFKALKLYDWIIDDILYKIIKFGRKSKFALFPPIPRFLKPYYYYRLIQFYFTGKV